MRSLRRVGEVFREKGFGKESERRKQGKERELVWRKIKRKIEGRSWERKNTGMLSGNY